MNQKILNENQREPELEREYPNDDIIYCPEPDDPEEKDPEIEEPEKEEDYGNDGCPGEIEADFWTCEFDKERELNESCNCKSEPEIEEEEETEETIKDYE